MPTHDEAAFRHIVDAFDIDLDASRVAFVDDEPVGFANLALRGDEAWVGGLGVVAAVRGRGVGEALMHAVHEEARERGVSKIWLEVVEENESAYRLYEKLGYKTVRDLDVWTLSAEASTGAARQVPAAQAHARIAELRTWREPWQRADATLAHYDDARGLETEGGAAVFRGGRFALLVQIAGADAPELLRTMRSSGTVRALNFPVGDPGGEALRDLGASLTVRQREMVLHLKNASGGTESIQG